MTMYNKKNIKHFCRYFVLKSQVCLRKDYVPKQQIISLRKSTYFPSLNVSGPQILLIKTQQLLSLKSK